MATPEIVNKVVDEADVILALDWLDLAGALKQTFGNNSGDMPVNAKIIQVSCDTQLHRGWSMDYQALPPVDVYMNCEADAAVPLLTDAVTARPKLIKTGGYALAGWLLDSPIPAPGRQQWRTLVIVVSVSLVASAGFTLVSWGRARLAASEARAERAQRAAAENQLRLLQSQLEPHMLFNTLANLRVLIGVDPARAQQMLDRLNSYLRATLNGSRASTHPLSAEFDRLRDYLELMSIRMGPRLAFTLDLPAGKIGSSAVEEDKELSASRDGARTFDGRVTQLLCDSNEFDPAGLGEFDFLWIDGGHDERTVRSDTENAYHMRRAGERSVIAWHDYRNPKYPELTRYLDGLSATRPLLFVEETMMVVDCALLGAHVARA